MATNATKKTAKAKPDETAGKAAERNVTLLNEEAFDGAVEMQMSFFEAASRFAQEFSDFAARRTESNVEDFSRFTAAKSPPELLQMQFEHMRTMFEDYSREASRILALTEDVMKQSGEAVRSSYLGATDLKKAG